eukprot:SAG22_NODE_2610_length_2383_cov_1.477671_3_plen_173_part_01
MAGCFGSAMLLGLLYIVVGAALMAFRTDVQCMVYTGTTGREWNVRCGSSGARCSAGICTCLDFACKEKQRQSLLAVKACGNGEGLGSWANGTDPCGGGWAGVTCAGGALTGLGNSVWHDVPKLTGDVGELAALTQLTSLDLDSTLVSGSVEPLAALTQLTILDLDSTLVSGSG